MSALEASRAARVGLTRGKRVEYVGAQTPRLIGKQGTITNARDRKGWIRVRFDFMPRRDDGVRCAACNLKVIEA